MNTATIGDAVRQVTATTKHAADSTAHIVSDMVGEAQERLEHAGLPSARRRVAQRRRTITTYGLVALFVVGGVVLRRIRAKDRTPEVAQNRPSRLG